jgi:S-adenosylmethionine synthetase
VKITKPLKVTLEYSDDNKPTRIDAIVISTQHDDFDEESIMLAKIKKLYRF